MIQTNFPVIDRVIELSQPYIDKIIEKIEKNENEKLSPKVRESFELESIYNLILALSKYILKTDTLNEKSVNFSINKGEVVTSFSINRDGKDFDVITEIISAGGYNIQRFHLRYIVHTKLPKIAKSSALDAYNEKIKNEKRLDKIKSEILNKENYINHLQNELSKRESYKTKEEAWRNSNLYEKYDKYDSKKFGVVRELFEELRAKNINDVWLDNLRMINVLKNQITSEKKLLQKFKEKNNFQESLIIDKKQNGGAIDMQKFNYQILKETEKALFIKVPFFEVVNKDKNKIYNQQFYELWIPKSIINKGDAYLKEYVLLQKDNARRLNPKERNISMPKCWQTMGQYAPNSKELGGIADNQINICGCSSHEKGGEIAANKNHDIRCENCGWTWNKQNSVKEDTYICYACGHNNYKRKKQ